MREDQYIDEFLDKLKIVWKQHPELGFSQLTSKLGKSVYMYYFVKDEEFLEKMERSISKGKIKDD